MSLGDMLTLLQFRKGQFSLIEEKVDPSSNAVGKAIRELDWPEQCALVAVIRKGELLLPQPEVVLQSADELFALVDSSKIGRLQSVLGPAAGL
jgi:trk/ktr system potassium uptake protein